ncbi:MAG: serine/threonine-protein kinase, partial [Candidatus Zixiibacteriota bacterium]
MGPAHETPRLFLDKKPLKIIRRLGEGAFADVFLAEWQNERLAVKILKVNQPSALEPFKQEYLLGKNICHSSFARFFRFGWTEEETPFYTMEYLEGKNIKDCWSKLDSLSKKMLCYQLFLGLTLLHKKGLVHRDLKPSNLLFIQKPKAKTPLQLKIMDLGLAQSADPLGEESVGGTVDYLAPELIRKEKPDARADFYACGIILCELFLGLPPFADPDPAATLARHQEAPLPELPIRNRKEKIFWQNLISRLAAKTKEERPKEAAELLCLLLEDPALRKALARQNESAANWCRTLLPRPWADPSNRLENGLSAEVPATVARAKEELIDKRDLSKTVNFSPIRLAIVAENSTCTYPRLSENELESWLVYVFGGSKEASKILWQKTSGEVCLIVLELAFWQKKKLVNWNGTSWNVEENRLKDVPLSPASRNELMALAAILPDEEQQLLGRLSFLLGFFSPEEISKTGLWEKSNLNELLKNLRKTNFIISLDENHLYFSRPGLREAL